MQYISGAVDCVEVCDAGDCNTLKMLNGLKGDTRKNSAWLSNRFGAENCAFCATDSCVKINIFRISCFFITL